jgi:ribosomal protein S18 acetylase RimI-like enzyme
MWRSTPAAAGGAASPQLGAGAAVAATAAHMAGANKARIRAGIGTPDKVGIVPDGVCYLDGIRTAATKTMLIRPIEDADIPAAAALLRRAAEAFILHESTPADAARFLAEQGEDALRGFIAAGYVYHVALLDGELAGFIGVRGRSHVYGLYVDGRWHRRGIARRLWETARAAALEGDPAHPGVFTVNASNYALPLYRALGFERTAPMQVAIVHYNPMQLLAV